MDSKIKPDIIKPKGQEAERRLCQLRVFFLSLPEKMFSDFSWPILLHTEC